MPMCNAVQKNVMIKDFTPMKKLSYGDFFSVWVMVLKNLDLLVNDFWPYHCVIHKSISIIFTSQLLKFKYIIVSNCSISTNGKIGMIKRH